MSDLFSYLSLPLTLFAIACIQAMSLQLILGGAGLLSLGHAAYVAVGGYAAGAASVFLLPLMGVDSAQWPIFSLIFSLCIGVLVSGLTGFLVALPCLRLQGDYLAMATLGFGEIVATLFKNLEVVGGTRGFKDIPKLTHFGALWLAVLLTAVFLSRLYRSPLGLAIVATRDDEIASRSLGISTSQAKVAAFVLGTALAGMAGGFQIHAVQFMSPADADFSRSVEILLAVVMGGMFSLRGSILGAFIMVGVPEILRFGPPWLSENRMIPFSLLVIILMISNPKGLTEILRKILPQSRGSAQGGAA